MRRVDVFLLIFTIVFSCFFVGCQEEKAKEITCYEIAAAYEEAGYVVWHDNHDEGQDEYCRISAQKEENAEDYIYFRVFLTEEGAEKAQEQDEYHIITWLFSAAFGEYRWLHSEKYGTIQYSYYDKSLAKPFNDLKD